MPDRRGTQTSWLKLIGDRADVGRSIVRLSRLAAVAHHAAVAESVAGAMESADRLTAVELSLSRARAEVRS